jgi:hypothetical protein
MHFTPFGQMEIAAPTGLISFTASNTSQVIPILQGHRRAQTADTGANH